MYVQTRHVSFPFPVRRERAQLFTYVIFIYPSLRQTREKMSPHRSQQTREEEISAIRERRRPLSIHRMIRFLMFPTFPSDNRRSYPSLLHTREKRSFPIITTRILLTHVVIIRAY
uniref:Uncharacterized protein n=1 Tax=Picea glauca TaxID=3330 RepID=A0A101M1J5_PICGL|nr:hypothetical protein ABT39_MTgene3761 [Picea glauca]QHR88291.1 hypothetical protein Q903MT_gene2304 [Picea sitchensis]